MGYALYQHARSVLLSTLQINHDWISPARFGHSWDLLKASLGRRSIVIYSSRRVLSSRYNALLEKQERLLQLQVNVERYGGFTVMLRIAEQN